MPFDLNDPEDLMAIFWYAFGVNKWEDAANAFFKAGPRSAAYLGRKALRGGVRSFLQQIAKKLGGEKLARKITERALLKLIVPGINMPIAYFANRWFTNKLGKIVVNHIRVRAAAIRPMKVLATAPRNTQLTSLAVIYQVGIQDEEPTVESRVVEMLDIVSRKLIVLEEETSQLEHLISLPFDQFLNNLNGRVEKPCAGSIIEKSSIAHLLSKSNKTSRAKLSAMVESLGATMDAGYLKKLKVELNV